MRSIIDPDKNKKNAGVFMELISTVHPEGEVEP